MVDVCLLPPSWKISSKSNPTVPDFLLPSLYYAVVLIILSRVTVRRKVEMSRLEPKFPYCGKLKSASEIAQIVFSISNVTWPWM
jgi:hypothetical protein